MASIKFNYFFLQLTWQRCQLLNEDGYESEADSKQRYVLNRNLKCKQMTSLYRDIYTPEELKKKKSHLPRDQLCLCYFHSAQIPDVFVLNATPSILAISLILLIFVYIYFRVWHTCFQACFYINANRCPNHLRGCYVHPTRSPFNPAWCACGSQRCALF